jgi:hypothetical protein
LWRKRNLIQSRCPTTSGPRDIPGRNNSPRWSRDQVDRAVPPDSLNEESPPFKALLLG